MINVLSWTLLHGPKSSCKRYSKSDEVLHQHDSVRKGFYEYGNKRAGLEKS